MGKQTPSFEDLEAFQVKIIGQRLSPCCASRSVQFGAHLEVGREYACCHHIQNTYLAMLTTQHILAHVQFEQ